MKGLVKALSIILTAVAFGWLLYRSYTVCQALVYGQGTDPTTAMSTGWPLTWAVFAVIALFALLFSGRFKISWGYLVVILLLDILTWLFWLPFIPNFPIIHFIPNENPVILIMLFDLVTIIFAWKFLLLPAPNAGQAKRYYRPGT